RAMDRVIDVARECGYLDGLPAFGSAETYGFLPRDKVVCLLTGSQGEPRAALARIAQDDHPEIALSPKDRVIFSSRSIPGNEKAVGGILNALALQGVEIITDRTQLVHVSGHPRRDELKMMYDWIKPQVAIPAHGEALHLSEHAAFARAQGVPKVIMAGNGDMIVIAGNDSGKVTEVAHGRVYQDGMLQVAALEKTIPERRKLSFAGIISVAIAVDEKGVIAGEAEISTMGLPPRTRDGVPFDELIADAVDDLIETLPKARRRDPEALRTSLEKAVRGAVAHEWGKKPVVHALVVEI
ncbi:MAG: MBL fold metallo-hydrolase RNA specificity domain-containing protein, partial [Bosea sp. (in: a-proteobacteria)]